jgi:hypothetical protein
MEAVLWQYLSPPTSTLIHWFLSSALRLFRLNVRLSRQPRARPLPLPAVLGAGRRIDC